jgi:hypothetical protein
VRANPVVEEGTRKIEVTCRENLQTKSLRDRFRACTRSFLADYEGNLQYALSGSGQISLIQLMAMASRSQ